MNVHSMIYFGIQTVTIWYVP